MRDFCGTLSTSVKQIKDPYLFDWEEGIALHAMQGNRASSFRDQESDGFSRFDSGKLGYVFELRRG